MTEHKHRPTLLTYSRPFPWLRRVWHLRCPGCPEDYVEHFPSRESAVAVRSWDSLCRELDFQTELAQYTREVDRLIAESTARINAIPEPTQWPTGTGWPA